MKICRTCGVEKTLGEFPDRTDAKDGKRNECDPCYKANRKAYRARVKDEVSAKRRAAYLAERDRIIEARRKFRKEEGDRINQRRREQRKEDPERFRQLQRDSYARNRERVLARVKARDFRRRTVQIESLLERDGSVCGICQEPLGDPKQAHVDHIYPRSLGGSNSIDNLQLAHASCNIRKQASVSEYSQAS